jgi:hypothetical protein
MRVGGHGDTPTIPIKNPHIVTPGSALRDRLIDQGVRLIDDDQWALLLLAVARSRLPLGLPLATPEAIAMPKAINI